MSAPFPPCPTLPTPREGLDWRSLNLFRGEARGAEFYHACLEYGHALWLRQLPARALLCLDRAMSAELHGDEPVLKNYPLPYAAMHWFMAHTPANVFIGNPRVHFQHYADRLNGPRSEQRRWRAWACWAVARQTNPLWPDDPKHIVAEPTLEQIDQKLTTHGHAGEPELWRNALAAIGPHKDLPSTEV